MSAPRRVTLVEPWPHGGTARYAAELARGLVQASPAGATIELLVPLTFPFDVPGAVVRRCLPVIGGIGGVARARFGTRGLVLAAQRRQQAAMVVKMTRERPPDVLHLLGTATASGTVLRAGREAGIPTVVTVHDLPFRELRPTHLLFSALSRHFHEADALVVHGEWSREQVSARYGPLVAARATVIAPGTYRLPRPAASRASVRARLRLPAVAPVVLFLGSRRQNKGLDLLIQAIGLERSGRVHLLVAGARASASEPPLGHFQAVAERHGIADRVTWCDRHLEEQELSDVVAAVDAAAIPYRKGFAAQSSILGMAAVAGLAVLATDVADVGAAVRQHGLGWCVEPDSAVALAIALGELGQGGDSACPERREAFVEATRWSVVGARVSALYDALPPVAIGPA